MGDPHLQLLLLLHPVNTILNHRGNQIFYAFYKVLVDVSRGFITGFFPTLSKCATKIKKIIYFVICSTNATQIFCGLGSIYYLIFFIFVRQSIFEVQIFKLRKTDVHFSVLYKQINKINNS